MPEYISITVYCTQVCELILNVGKEGAKKAPHLNSPLMYTWHGKLYVGAAHGISGILHTLMEVLLNIACGTAYMCESYFYVCAVVVGSTSVSCF